MPSLSSGSNEEGNLDPSANEEGSSRMQFPHRCGLQRRLNPDPGAAELRLLKGLSTSGRHRGPPSGQLLSPGVMPALLQNAGPRVRAASARTSASSARGGFSCTRGSVCPPARWAPWPSPAHGSARVSAGLLALPPSLAGLVRAVRGPGRTIGECHVVLGGPTGDVRDTQGPSMHWSHREHHYYDHCH